MYIDLYNALIASYGSDVPVMRVASTEEDAVIRSNGIAALYDQDDREIILCTCIAQHETSDNEWLVMHECGHYYTWAHVQYDTHTQMVYAEACAHAWAYLYAYMHGYEEVQEAGLDYLKSPKKNPLYKEAGILALSWIESGNYPATVLSSLRRR